MSREKQILKNLEERNELVDLLQDIGRDWDNYIDECQESETTPCIDYDDFHADSILAAGYRKQEWISVDERLPKESGEYITFHEHGSRGVIYYNASIHLWNVYYFEDVHNAIRSVTHWMPLPEPPKMKGEKNG